MSLLDRDAPEISDVIVDFDAATLARLPVRKDEAIERFRSIGRTRAARIVAAIPERDGVLDNDAVDDILLTAHYELQRLSEEFDHGRRVAELLAPILSVARAAGVSAPRVVDIGCGTGFVIRWLAAFGDLGEVELVGADYNLTLIDEARRLAQAESLRCGFVAGNAFTLNEPATVYLSTGAIHHFRGDALGAFLGHHDTPSALAFAHFDFQSHPLAPIGAWLFHAIRMRQPLSRHDGYWSNVRAHSGATLLEAAGRTIPSFACALYNAKLGPFPRVFHTLLGIRPALRADLATALGPRARRLGEWST